MAKKIIGWVLLVVGILIIAWGVWSSYNIFTTKEPVPQVFEIPEAYKNVNSEEKREEPTEENGEEGTISEEEEAQRRAGEIIKEQIAEILPFDFITKFFNLIAWSIFMAILILAGGKIAGIGIKLLAVKEVLVAKEAKEEYVPKREYVPEKDYSSESEEK